MIKLFIQHAASFDFAFLTEHSGAIGRSFYLDVTFAGTLNAKGMLIDFSYAKKIVKSVVKDIDHKLFVSKKYIKYKTKSHIIVSNSVSKMSSQKSNSFFAMHSNRTWVKIVSGVLLKALENEERTQFENLISKEIFVRLPGNVHNISVQLKEKRDCIGQHDNENDKSLNELNSSRNNYFHYTHSLCHHAGNCQRFHGHSAQVCVFVNNILDSNQSAYAAQKIKGLYLISGRHLCPMFDSSHLEKIRKYCFQKTVFARMQNHLHAFEYRGSKGKVSIIIAKHLSLLLPHESTIENIAQYIRGQMPADQDALVRVYEGLSKGAVAG